MSVITPEKKKDLEKQGYRLVGNHSAIKVCSWTKDSIRNKDECDVCYKNTFYGIRSWRCVQMTPAVHTCSHRCCWCWRDIHFTNPTWEGAIDEPSDIVEGCVKEHVKYLRGFLGSKDSDKYRLAEAFRPAHFAISLSGEPTSYPRLPELIAEIHKRGMTSFLVTNGTNPEMLGKLIESNNLPTQFYMTLPAPDEKTYLGACKPAFKDSWKKILQSLQLMSKFKRRTIRLTLAKHINMVMPEKYAELINSADFDFLELKAYMWVGYSKERLEMENMPLHEDIMEFAEKLAKFCDLKIIDQKKESRVALLMKKDQKERLMKFKE